MISKAVKPIKLRGFYLNISRRFLAAEVVISVAEVLGFGYSLFPLLFQTKTHRLCSVSNLNSNCFNSKKKLTSAIFLGQQLFRQYAHVPNELDVESFRQLLQIIPTPQTST